MPTPEQPTYTPEQIQAYNEYLQNSKFLQDYSQSEANKAQAKQKALTPFLIGGGLVVLFMVMRNK